jgi:hypothetical protein
MKRIQRNAKDRAELTEVSHSPEKTCTLSDIKFPTTAHLLKFPLPSYSTKLGTKPLSHRTFGNTYANYSILLLKLDPSSFETLMTRKEEKRIVESYKHFLTPHKLIKPKSLI